MHKFEETLNRLQVAETELSKANQVKIAELRGMVSGLSQIQAQLATANPQGRKEMESDISELKGEIDGLDNSLSVAIEKWYPRRDKIADNVKKMTEARKKALEGKKGKGGTVGADGKPTTTPEPEKKNGVLTGLAFVGLALAGLIVGVNLLNKS